jgi:hypothetical protein
MKIIRWLLSHAFLILIIVAVIYGYMFWGNLAGEGTPAGKALAYLSDEFVEVKDFVDAVKAKQAKLEGKQSSGSNQQINATTDATAAASEQNSSAESVISDVEQQPASIIYSHNNNRVEQNSFASDAETPVAETPGINARPMPGNVASQSGAQTEITSDMATQDVPSAVAVNDKKEVYVSPDIEQQLNQVDETGKVASESTSGKSVRDVWITARKAFYQRNYALSEQSYQEVIAGTVDNFDACGELGNVYFNQGKNEQAASAYFDAAAIMVRKGQVNRARSLMGLLRHLDKSKADELQKLLDSN